MVALPECPMAASALWQRASCSPPARCDAVLIGPGMLDEEAVALISAVLDGADGPTFVLDAGALARLAEIRSRFAARAAAW